MIGSHHQHPGSENILANMADAYATCSTYRDTGSVHTRFFNVGDAPERNSIKPFATAFIRPNRFRFEYWVEESGNHTQLEKSKKAPYIVCASGDDVQVWWQLKPEVLVKGSLELALAGATGVSGGSANTIPALLMPDKLHSRKLTQLTDLVLLEDASVEGRPCYRIQGQIAQHEMNEPQQAREEAEFLEKTGRALPKFECGPTILFLDQQTFLVRRIEATTVFSNFQTETVTNYKPEVNGKISEDDLRFSPPGVSF